MTFAPALTQGDAAHLASHILQHFQRNGDALLTSALEPFGLGSIVVGLLFGAVVVSLGRLRRGRRMNLRLLGRLVRPRRQFWGASGGADVKLWFVDKVSWVIGVTVFFSLSQQRAAGWIHGMFRNGLGPHPAHEAGALSAIVASVVIFIAFDLAHWIDHWLSHNVPALWAIHKVHHTAEALSPLTVYRTHPLENIKFASVVGLIVGATNGVLDYWMGGHQRFLLMGIDIVAGTFVIVAAHLQHTHIWVSLQGTWGKLFVSPAHHQIHHSLDARHFGRNLGNSLAVWDWAFGTLFIPPARSERLRFGLPQQTAAVHTWRECLITPVVEATQEVRCSLQSAAVAIRGFRPNPPSPSPAVQTEETSWL